MADVVEDKEVEEATGVGMATGEEIAEESRQRTFITHDPGRQQLQLAGCRRQLAQPRAPPKRLHLRHRHHQLFRSQLLLSQNDRRHRNP